MPDYRWASIKTYKAAPMSSGVYAIYEDGRLTYVGSGCVRRRLYVHVYGGRFGVPSHLKVRQCADGLSARLLERRLIRRLRPIKNRVINVALAVRGRIRYSGGY